jgi:excisionase family DNA binding protein
MTATHEAGIKPALLASAVMPDEASADLDRILGDDALFMLKEACKRLRISMPSIYRGMRAGRIPYVLVGSRRAITRPVMKRLLRNGVGPFSRGKKPTAAAD